MAKAISGHSMPKKCYGHGHSDHTCDAAPALAMPPLPPPIQLVVVVSILSSLRGIAERFLV